MSDKVSVRSPKKLKILIEVPLVGLVKVHVLSFNMILLSSSYRVPRPSYQFRRNFGRSDKVSLTEKAKIVKRGSQCSPREITCSNLQYDPYLISVACSYTEITISEKIWAIR